MNLYKDLVENVIWTPYVVVSPDLLKLKQKMLEHGEKKDGESIHIEKAKKWP